MYIIYIYTLRYNIYTNTFTHTARVFSEFFFQKKIPKKLFDTTDAAGRWTNPGCFLIFIFYFFEKKVFDTTDAAGRGTCPRFSTIFWPWPRHWSFFFSISPFSKKHSIPQMGFCFLFLFSDSVRVTALLFILFFFSLSIFLSSAVNTVVLYMSVCVCVCLCLSVSVCVCLSCIRTTNTVFKDH